MSERYSFGLARLKGEDFVRSYDDVLLSIEALKRDVQSWKGLSVKRKKRITLTLGAAANEIGDLRWKTREPA